MRFRKLRIAWSVMCGIACVLLIVLWVRSYWWQDFAIATLPGQRSVAFKSMQSRLYLGIADVPLPGVMESKPAPSWEEVVSRLALHQHSFAFASSDESTT